MTIGGISIQGSDVAAVLRDMLHPSSHLGDRQWGVRLSRLGTSYPYFHFRRFRKIAKNEV